MLTIDFKKTPISSGDRILDLGCGEGRHSTGAYASLNNVDVIGVDLSIKDLQTAKNRHIEYASVFENNANPTASQCWFSQADGLKLPFADGSFDHVICSEVLEHIPDYSAMISEALRVLKNGGSLSISVPNAWPEKICWYFSSAYHQVEGGHIRIFKAKALRKEIESLSAKLKHQHKAHSLHVPYWWLRCLFWNRGEDFLLTRLYHKILVWDLLKKPRLTQCIDKLLNPLMGKSVVMYFEKG